MKDGDVVLWYYATFGATGGPPTLEVKAATKKGCYIATAYDDNGKAASVTGLQWHVGLEDDRRGRDRYGVLPEGARRVSSCVRRRPAPSGRTP